MREKAARQKTDEWKAIDNEIRQHPTPKDSDGKIQSGRLVGKWSSPRHDYQYKGDGSWTMLPADEGTTHGTWRIDGNQFFRLTRPRTQSFWSPKGFRSRRP